MISHSRAIAFTARKMGLSSDYDTTRYFTVQRFLSPEFRSWYVLGEADEVRSGVGMGSGTIHITGLVRHSFETRVVSLTIDQQVFW